MLLAVEAEHGELRCIKPPVARRRGSLVVPETPSDPQPSAVMEKRAFLVLA